MCVQWPFKKVGILSSTCLYSISHLCYSIKYLRPSRNISSVFTADRNLPNPNPNQNPNPGAEGYCGRTLLLAAFLRMRRFYWCCGAEIKEINEINGSAPLHINTSSNLKKWNNLELFNYYEFSMFTFQLKYPILDVGFNVARSAFSF